MEIGPIEQAFEDSISEMTFDSSDKAAVELARNIASQLDVEYESALFTKLGHEYLAVLEALQMTPRARAIAQKGMKGNDPGKPKSRLDELRERRARKSRAETVDATAEGLIGS